MVLHPSLPTPCVLAPPLAAAVAFALRVAGVRFRRPALRFGAGGAGLMVGFGVIQGVRFVPGNLAVFAGVALLAAAAAQTTPPPPVKGRKGVRVVPRRVGEAQLWLAGVAVFGGWWLAPSWTMSGWMMPGGLMLAGAAVIAIAGVSAWQGWAVAAASISLWAALLAVGADPSLAALALVPACASVALVPALPLTAGLGGVVAWALESGFRRLHPAPAVALADLAPLLCLGLMWWWRARFRRFGRAADLMRAGTAAAVSCVAAFSAAALQGFR